MSELSERLAAVEALARELRSELPDPAAPPDPDELLALAASHELPDRLLTDVGEATRQLFVAGVAYPDPELSDELRALARRAERLGLPEALERLLRVEAYLQALSGERDLLRRADLSDAVWHETQRLVAWQRLFRTEHDLNVVQARLAEESQLRRVVMRRPRRYPTMDADVWPDGVALVPPRRVVVYGRQLGSGRPVRLVDELADLEPTNPLRGESISRLLREPMVLVEVLRSVVRLERHPYAEDGEVLVFRPSFRAQPRLLPVGSGFEPPPLPELPLDARGAPGLARADRPHRLWLRIVGRGARLTVGTRQGASAGLALSPLLRANLTKLLAREGVDELEVEGVVMRGDEDELRLLALETELDGRTFPADDSRVFALHPTVLARRAWQDAANLDSLAGAWLRTAAALFGGAPAHLYDTLREAVEALEPRGLREHYRAGVVRLLLDEDSAPPELPGLLRHALRIAATPAGSPVDVDALAQVLGRDPGQASGADLGLLDGAALYEAVWLVAVHELEEELEAELRALLEARYAGQLEEPSWGDVCARSLLLALSRRGDEETSKEALAFLDAHLARLKPRAGTGRKLEPLPEMLELFQLADARARIVDDGHDAGSLEELGLEGARERLRQVCADRLYAWLAGKSEEPARARLRAADAMLVMARSELGAEFVGV